MIFAFWVLLILHFIGDFVIQTHWQAVNKSKNNLALLKHVGSYTTVLAVGTFVVLPQTANVFYFLLTNAVLHFATDWVTSRINSKLFAKERYHDFFVGVGADQLVHQMTLGVTLVGFWGGGGG